MYGEKALSRMLLFLMSGESASNPGGVSPYFSIWGVLDNIWGLRFYKKIKFGV